MQFFKLITSDSEVRWINLAQISRATLAQEHGKPLLALLFIGDSPGTKLTIHGSSERNIEAINDLTARLDALTGGQ